MGLPCTATLWSGISEPYADIIRSFLLYFHSQITAARTPVRFDFGGAVQAELILPVA
jgi:hypothetical protein